MKIKYLILLVLLIIISFLVFYNISPPKDVNSIANEKQILKAKLEILKKVDTLVVEKILLDEKGDTLREENLSSKTIYSYNNYRKIVREDFYFHYYEGNYVEIPKLLYSVSYFYDENQNLIKKKFIKGAMVKKIHFMKLNMMITIKLLNV